MEITRIRDNGGVLLELFELVHEWCWVAGNKNKIVTVRLTDK
jgi:hypothetical protein